ncbi:aspartate kinase [soil metagenome]
MQVFKFGGASVRHADGIRQVANIIQLYSKEKLLIVVSAMGKTTNSLEKILENFSTGKNFLHELATLRSYHESVIHELFGESGTAWKKVASEFDAIPNRLKKEIPKDQLYDQIVSQGEVISSIILAEYLLSQKLNAELLDARKFILTDNTFREGKVDWEKTERKVAALKSQLENKIFITQGFIGSCDTLTVTLGREGSDYTAAIFASCLMADSVTIWKDVPGVMNADPKRLPDAVVFEELPFREAAEMTYYGASIIHPKTIKPLANRNIPLFVKNFDDPSLPGTVIHETKIDFLPPLIVFKDDQCLVSCRVTDYTFIDEQQLSFIFQALSEFNIKINVMQNSAISFSFCIDYREDKVAKLIDLLAKHFEVYYNTGLTLITIKNYDAASAEKYRKMPGVLLEQLSRSTLQVLIKN